MFHITTYRIHSSLKNNKEELIIINKIINNISSATLRIIYGNKNRNKICHFYSYLFSFIILFSFVISNVSYSSLRFAPLYCLIHTPLSPLSVCQPPRRGTVRHPYPIFRGDTHLVMGLLLVDRGTVVMRWGKGVLERETPLFPP